MQNRNDLNQVDKPPSQAFKSIGSLSSRRNNSRNYQQNTVDRLIDFNSCFETGSFSERHDYYKESLTRKNNEGSTRSQMRSINKNLLLPINDSVSPLRVVNNSQRFSYIDELYRSKLSSANNISLQGILRVRLNQNFRKKGNFKHIRLESLGGLTGKRCD